MQALITKPFIQELFQCAVRDGVLMDMPGLTEGSSTPPASLGAVLADRQSASKAQTLSEWKRRQSTHLMPRGIHEHGKKNGN